MKHLKKIAGLLLAVVMMLAMCVTAFAATVTVNVDSELSTHTFRAYQVFKGTQADGATDANLSDIAWGKDINSADFLNALKAQEEFGKNEQNAFYSCSSAQDVAKVLETSEITAKAEAVARIVKKYVSNGTPISGATTNLEPGYYLIVDNTAELNGDVNNGALLQVTTDINITKKTDKPEVEKKVKEHQKNIDSGEDIYGEDYNDVADYHIGEDVDFKLIGTVPEMKQFDTYKYVFHDKMSKGLTFNKDVRVYACNNKAGKNKEEITSYTVDNISTDSTTGETSFSITFNDLKTVTAGSKNISEYKYILAEYTAKLNTNAEVGLPGNPNEVKLEYSNNPDNGGTGETEKDKVIVFTYKLKTTKVDGKDNTKLAGAKFKLQRTTDKKWLKVTTDGKVNEWVDNVDNADELESDSNGVFTIVGLDSGIYKLLETKAPDRYNKLNNPLTVVLTATTVNNQTWAGTPKQALTAIDVSVDNVPGTGNIDEGSASITVANNKGSQLPETGGIGTTIFYVVGVVLMLGAGVLLITKRRMSAKH